MSTYEKHIYDVPAMPDPDFVPQVRVARPGRLLDELMSGRLYPNGAPLDPNYSRFEFDYLGAQQFIDLVAVYDGPAGVLDMETTSANLGIPLIFGVTNDGGRSKAQLGGTGRNRGKSPLELTVQHDLGFEIKDSFGHEIGHYFLDEVAEVELGGWTEKFCDFFARAMVFGRNAAQNVVDIDEGVLLGLMTKHQLDLQTLLLQLIEYGNLPPRVAIDSYYGKGPNVDYSEKVGRTFACLHCTETTGDFNCPNSGKDGALFDFTDRAWHGLLPQCMGGWTVEHAAVVSSLTKYYQSRAGQLALFAPEIWP